MLRQKAQLIALLIVVLIAVFSVSDRPTAGQQQFPESNRKPACTIFCGDPSPVPKVNYFWLFTKEEEQAGKCYGGPLPADKANNFYNNDLSAEQRSALCNNLKNTAHEPTRACPVFKRLEFLCKSAAPENEPPKKDCEKPTPWFGNPSNCKDVQSWTTAKDGQEVTLSVCGVKVFRYVVPFNEDVDALWNNAAPWRSVGSKVCCDRLLEAARTGVPCDPRTDIDCDGTPNEKDIAPKSNDPRNPIDAGTPYPAINTPFRVPDVGTVDPFPQGLDLDDTEFFPPHDQCGCKWELVKGTLTCGTDGRLPHVYTAQWRCPSNGSERLTKKEARATAPCTPPRR